MAGTIMRIHIRANITPCSTAIASPLFNNATPPNALYCVRVLFQTGFYR